MARDPAFNTVTARSRSSGETDVLASPTDALSAPSNDDLLSASLSFWPTGSAWGSPDGEAVALSSNLAKLTRVLIDPFVWLYGRAQALANESTVQGAAELLREWETEYGLPERCFAVSEQPTSTRIRALAGKVRADAVNHPEQFIALALDYGFEIEIEEPAIFECGFSECGGQHSTGSWREETYWIVRVRNASVSYFEVGTGVLGEDPLFSFGEAEQILCLLRQMAPAWTLPVLHPWINYIALADENGRIIGGEHGNKIHVTA